MTIEETIDLLTVAASFDRRTLGEGDAIAWHAAVGDLRYGDCRDAVVAHYTETTDWLMPAHVRERVREIRAVRLKRTEIPPPPPELLDNPTAYSACLRAAATAIADGCDPAPVIAAITRQARRGELEASS